MCRGSQARQLTTFDSGEVLSNRIDLGDIGAACEKKARGFLLFLQRKWRRRTGNQRGGAAGKEAEHKIVLFGRSADFRNTAAACESALIRDGMAGRLQFDVARFAGNGRIAVPDVDATGGDAGSEMVL